MPSRVYIGTAGWSIPRAAAGEFAGDGTHLQRYAQVLSCAEINSSFYRPHAATTYARWRESTPPAFRFAVKVPRTITHERRLRAARAPLERFLGEVAGLGDTRGPLLVQLPPSLDFDARVAGRFLAVVRSMDDGVVVCEPRHPSWFSPRATDLLARHRVARVAADPAPVPTAGAPTAWDGVVYFRLHGTPRMYWSRYTTEYLEALAASIRECPRSTDVWCVFDNTASGAAIENALELQALLRG